MKLRLALLVLLSASFAGLALAEDAAKEKAPTHRIVHASEIQWKDAPPSLPGKIKMAVLQGDPTQPGMFAMRVMIPAGYVVHPHWHPADENVTVISGELHVATGEKEVEHEGHVLKAGDFSVMPAGVRHYVWTPLGAVIQVHGMGPWGLNYVNPADDPRGPAPAAK